MKSLESTCKFLFSYFTTSSKESTLKCFHLILKQWVSVFRNHSIIFCLINYYVSHHLDGLKYKWKFCRQDPFPLLTHAWFLCSHGSLVALNILQEWTVLTTLSTKGPFLLYGPLNMLHLVNYQPWAGTWNICGLNEYFITLSWLRVW